VFNLQHNKILGPMIKKDQNDITTQYLTNVVVTCGAIESTEGKVERHITWHISNLNKKMNELRVHMYEGCPESTYSSSFFILY
jgi:Uri superfamily endonuclease